MSEREPRWYDEPRWYYVGNGQRRYRDGGGWTDRYEDIDSPTQTLAAEHPEHPAAMAVLEPAVAGARRFGAACRRIRSRRRGGPTGRLESPHRAAAAASLLLSPESMSPESMSPESMSPEWQAALRVGADHPALPGVRPTTPAADAP